MTATKCTLSGCQYDTLVVLLDQSNRHKVGRGQYLDEARARIAELEAALRDAIDCVEANGAYSGDLRATLDRTGEPT